MGRPGVCQVPEGNGEQRKVEETGCEIICSARVKVKRCEVRFFTAAKLHVQTLLLKFQSQLPLPKTPAMTWKKGAAEEGAKGGISG